MNNPLTLLLAIALATALAVVVSQPLGVCVHPGDPLAGLVENCE